MRSLPRAVTGRLWPADTPSQIAWTVTLIVLLLVAIVAWRIWAALSPAEFVTLDVYTTHLTSISSGVTVSIDRVTPRHKYEVRRRRYETGRRGPFVTKSGVDDVFIEGTVRNGADRTLLVLTFEGAGIRTDDGSFVPLAVTLWDAAGKRTLCEGRADRVEIPPGAELRYSAQLSPGVRELRSPALSMVEQRRIPALLFSPLGFGVCLAPEPGTIEQIRFDNIDLGKPSQQDFYPFGIPSCDFAGPIAPSGRPYWIPPEGAPPSDCSKPATTDHLR